MFNIFPPMIHVKRFCLWFCLAYLFNSLCLTVWFCVSFCNGFGFGLNVWRYYFGIGWYTVALDWFLLAYVSPMCVGYNLSTTLMRHILIFR